MRKYIQLNTELRTKDFFKLMNNCVFSKTMEDIERHFDVKLVTNHMKHNKLVAKPNFDRDMIFSEDLVAVHVKKTKVVYNKRIYLGMPILELCKTLMYKVHYD